MREKEFLPMVSAKLKIDKLNPMQETMLRQGCDKSSVILLSPTGSGKTLAFVLPVLKMLKPSTGRVQAVVIAPSRELVIQIAGIIREVASGFKVSPLYGGHKVEDEQNSLSVTPDIIVATPGRLLDHINRRNVDVLPTRILVLDEFDKSLELGFEEEMRKIVLRLKNVSRIILTSATDMAEFPDYLPMRDAERFDFLSGNKALKRRMLIRSVATDCRDKLEGLLVLLKDRSVAFGGEGRAIVFVNHRESADRVAGFLKSRGVDCAVYHGELDQRDREKAVAMFNNGSCPVLVATDLASRGLDIEGVKSIVHYHQPFTEEAYTHRNGRTARVDAEGEVFVLLGSDEDVKPFIIPDDNYDPVESDSEIKGKMKTLYIGEGKKEKLSRGDILGFLVKECGLEPSQVGKINVYDHYILAAIDNDAAQSIEDKLKTLKIKGKKRRIEFA